MYLYLLFLSLSLILSILIEYGKMDKRILFKFESKLIQRTSRIIFIACFVLACLVRLPFNTEGLPNIIIFCGNLTLCFLSFFMIYVVVLIFHRWIWE